MPSSRETILSTIRRALAVPSPRPGAHDAPSSAHAPHFENTLPILGQEQPRAWLPPVGDSWDDWAQLFAANALDLRAEFTICADENELNAHLQRLASDNGWRKIATHGGELSEAAARVLALETLMVDDGYDAHELEKCDAGVTLCDALVAQTGSVLMTNASAGGRVLSVLPPHHIVLARRDQLLPDLPAAFALLEAKYGAAYPSLMGLITGPSRTGDIERILVLGAHGPKKLSIFLV